MRWLRVVGAAAVALVPLLAGSPTSVAAAQRLTLVSEQFNVTVGDSLALVVQVPAVVDLTTLGDFTVTVTAYRAVATREAVAQAVKGILPRSVDSVDVPSADVVRPAAGQLQVSIPIEATTRTAAALQLAQPGLYPLTVELQSRGTLVADLATFVHRVPSAAEPPDESLPVAMVMTTSSAVTLSGAGRVVLSTADIAQLTHLADVLEASAVPVAVRIPAALLAALPDSGAEGEALAVRLTAELQRDEVLSTPSLPLDPSSAAAAGQQALYTQWLRDGEDSLATSTSANPVRTAVVVDSPLSQGGGALLRDLGARLLVLPVDLYYGLPNTLGGFTDTTQLVQIQVSPGVTVDATVVDRVASNNLALSSTTPTLSAIYAVSDLLAARQQIDDNGGDPRRHSITLATPDLSAPAESTVKAFTDLLADTPGLRATTLDELSVRTDQLLNDGRPVVVDLPATAGGDIKDRTDLANALGLEAASTSSMLPTDDERIAEWTRLVGVVPSSALTQEQAVVIAADLRAQYLAVRSSVKVPAGFSFNLTGRTTTVPVTLRNDADIALTVTVRMSSSKLLFPDGDQTVTLPPQSYFEVRIPIEARSNGRFPVSLAVFTPLGGVPIAPPVPLTASVNAFSGLGNLVTGAALLIVLSWWLRHFRRNRRARAAADTAQRHPVGRAGDAAPHETMQHGGDLSPDAATSTLPPS